MLFHELPPAAQLEILDRVSPDVQQIWIADISPTYRPSEMMRIGEPYLDEYLRTFEATAHDFAVHKNMTLFGGMSYQVMSKPLYFKGGKVYSKLLNLENL